MADKIIMPQLGESIAEGTIVKWLKAPGDAVKKDENVLLISTDKVEAEIPSPSTGVLLSIDVEPGKTVNVGTVLGYVGQAGETEAAKPAVPAVQTPQAAPAPAQASTPTPAAEQKPPTETLASAPTLPPAPAAKQSEGSNRFLSPLVRRIADEHKITEHEIGLLPGSGRDGRVTKTDILQYVQVREAGPTKLGVAAPTLSAPQVSIPAGERELIQPMSTMRKVIMENMVNSKRTSPHVTTFFDIDYTRVDRIREQHKERFKAEEGVALTYTTFIAAAVCQALKRHPYVNAEIMGDKIKFKKDIHLGMAVSIEQPEPGLMVPVVKNADQMNLRGMARAITDLAGRVRSKKIKPDELSGGTFTITNPGNFGAIIGTPIINQPQVAILGVGNIKKQPVVIEVDGSDTIGIRKIGWLSLSFDHRLVDGATADMFMADLKKTLENWTEAP